MSHSILAIFHNLPMYIAQGGYWLMFIIVVLEGIPLAGSLLPGHIVVIAAGFLIKVGVLNLYETFAVLIVAALIGDGIGYIMGKKYGYNFLTKFGKIIYLKEEYLEKMRQLISAHTGKALVLGKFSPLSRPLTPFLVGANGVRAKTFWIFNTLGALSWVISSLLVGYIFGASYHVAAQAFGKYIVVALIATLLIVFAYRFVNKSFHVFKKYELFVLALNLLSLWALAKSIQDALSAHSFMVNFDISVNLFMAHHVTPLLASLAAIISYVGSTAVTAGIGVFVGIGYLLKMKRRRGAIFLLSICSTSMAVFLLKEIFLRVRPVNALISLSDPSFPSGHAALAAALFISVAYIFARHIHSWVKRETLIVACALAIILIGLSRIVLNVHWASDVIAGWCLGIFLASASILFVKYAAAIFASLTERFAKTENLH